MTHGMATTGGRPLYPKISCVTSKCSGRCSCKAHNLTCTELCKCKGAEDTCNTVTIDQNSSDDEDDEDLDDYYL